MDEFDLIEAAFLRQFVAEDDDEAWMVDDEDLMMEDLNLLMGVE